MANVKNESFFIVSYGVMALLALCAMVSCQREFKPQNGDLVFTVGDSEFSSAIKSATARYEDVPYTHVGIVWVHGDTISIVEAGDSAVVVTPYETFLDNAMSDGNKRCATVCRVNASQDVRNAAVARALTFLNQPYDNAFMVDNGMMYCTELVWEAFLDEAGKHIFTASPMNFYAPDGTLPQFWLKHFEALGVEVPQGELGTNPVDMSKESVLKPVHYYF